MSERFYIVGEPRSGKSALAERLGEDLGGPHFYLATLPPSGQTAGTIARHVASRNAKWKTSEFLKTDLAEVAILRGLAESGGTILLEGFQLWSMRAITNREGPGIFVEFCDILEHSRANWIVVDVVGFPPDAACRRALWALRERIRGLTHCVTLSLLGSHRGGNNETR